MTPIKTCSPAELRGERRYAEQVLAGLRLTGRRDRAVLIKGLERRVARIKAAMAKRPVRNSGGGS